MGNLWCLDYIWLFRKSFTPWTLLLSRDQEKTSIILLHFLFAFLMTMPRTIAFVKTKYICNRITRLNVPQRNMCYENPATAVAIDEGSHMGLQECHRQFKHNRWNCKMPRNSSAIDYDPKLGTREAAYDGAIRSAGVFHAVATACAEGHLRDCGCATNKRGYLRRNAVYSWSTTFRKGTDGVVQLWTWGGCSVDVKRAVNYCKQIWDVREVSSTPRAVMNLHNYDAGRKAVIRKLRMQCKCHGVSSSCTTNTCWVTLPDFRDVGNALKIAYKRSRRVSVIPHSCFSTRYPQLAYAENNIPIKPSKRELIYLEDSPSYCKLNSTLGSQGTAGRVCRKKAAEDDCIHLCCGKGYKIQTRIRQWECKCKFYWCCQVHCKQCEEIGTQYICL